jgi:hypothetical protein
MQKMLDVEFGGMSEVLANLAAVTGEEKYFRLAQRFNHKAVLGPLGRGEDPLNDLHANTQFPKLIGAGRQYELTGDHGLRDMAKFSWEVVTKERSYVIGGNSDREMFKPKEQGGIWDGNNATNRRGNDRPSTYTGALLNFFNCRKFSMKRMTLQNPEVYHTRFCKLYDFVIEDIRFQTTLLRRNQDGIHLCGNCEDGVIRNISIWMPRGTV